jgi:WD40 repeat protein
MFFKYAELDDHIRDHSEFLESFNILVSNNFNNLSKVVESKIQEEIPREDILNITENKGKIDAFRKIANGIENIALTRSSPGCIDSFNWHKFPVYKVYLDEEGKQLFSISSSGHIVIYRLNERKMKVKSFDSKINPYNLFFCWDEGLVFYQDKDSNEIKAFDLLNNEKTDIKFKNHSDKVYGIIQSRLNPNVFFTCSTDNSVRGWDFPTELNIFTFEYGANGFYSCMLNYKETFLYVGCGGGQLLIYDIGHKQVSKVLEDGHSKEVCSMVMTKDCKTLYTCSHDGLVALWDLEKAALVKTIRPADNNRNRLNTLILSASEKTIYTAGSNGIIYKIDIDTWAVKESLIGHQNDVMTLTVSSNESTLYSGGLDGLVKVWSLNLLRYEGKPKVINFEKFGSELIKMNFGPNVEIEEVIFHEEPIGDEDDEENEYVLTIEEEGEPVLTMELKLEPPKKVTVEENKMDEEVPEESNILSPENMQTTINEINMTLIPMNLVKENAKFWEDLVNLIEDRFYKLCLGSYVENGEVIYKLFLRNLVNESKGIEIISKDVKTLLDKYK